MNETHPQAQPETQCRDALTGLYNRREFDLRLIEECSRSKRYGRVFSMLMFDIDHFGAVNGNHGHITGNLVLRGIADIIRTSTRSPDLLARYGGGEFAAILPESGKPGACAAAQRLLAAISGHTFGVEHGQALTITVSIGVAGIPDDADSGESLVAAADSALREAKRAGRNCVRASSLERGAETRR